MTMLSDADQTIEYPLADPPEEIDEYTIVLLYRGLNPPDLDDDASWSLQRQHLGHLQSMKKRGELLVSGPFTNQPDETLRGLCIYRSGLEEAKRLAESDPAVRRGRLRVVAFKWLTAKGVLHAKPQ